MGNDYKILGQVSSTIATLVTLYTVPADTQAVCSTLTVCNLGVSTTYRIAVRKAGGTIDPKHYVVYDAALSQYDSVVLTIGISLEATDVVSVYAGTSNVSFNLFGAEITA
jgi:hypothetical protein